MSILTRRTFTLGLMAGTPLVAACGNGVGNSNAATIDARVDATLSQMYSRYPNTRDLAAKSNGMLIMPVVTEAGFLVGGGFGRGAHGREDGHGYDGAAGDRSHVLQSGHWRTR
mgnify:CR=1 FL=1